MSNSTWVPHGVAFLRMPWVVLTADELSCVVAPGSPRANTRDVFEPRACFATRTRWQRVEGCDCGYFSGMIARTLPSIDS